MEYAYQQPIKFDPQKADQLLDFVAWPDIWLDDKLPGLLKAINKEQKLIPMKILGSEQHMGFLMGLRNAFRDKMEKKRKLNDAEQGKRRSEGGE